MVWHVQVAADTTKSVKLQLFGRSSPKLTCDSIGSGSGPAFEAALFSKPVSFDARERRVPGVIPHTYAIGSSVQCDGTEGSTMYLIYGLLILAMIFFFVLPITDARTARMKVSVVGSLGVLLAVCAVVPRLIH
jgi:hypothetical protein